MHDLFLCYVSRAEGGKRACGGRAGRCCYCIICMLVYSYDAADKNNQETSPKWNLAASTSLEMALREVLGTFTRIRNADDGNKNAG
jgi:hypothetical protein